MDEKTLVTVAIAGALGYFLTNTALLGYSLHRASEDVVYELPLKVTIVVPIYREPDKFVQTCLESLRAQSLFKEPKNDIEIVAVCGEGVNIDLVTKYADKVTYVSRGKLKARHVGFEIAKGDIVVSVDADCYYPPAWLAHLLRPYLEEENVVATTGPTVNKGTLGLLQDVFCYMFKHAYYAFRLSGRNCSILKKAYYAVGGFDISKDTASLEDILYEEEVKLYRKLTRIGKVVYVPEAVCIHYGVGKDRNRGLRKSLQEYEKRGFDTLQDMFIDIYKTVKALMRYD